MKSLFITNSVLFQHVFYCLGQVIGIEPTSSGWKPDALTVVLYPHASTFYWMSFHSPASYRRSSYSRDLWVIINYVNWLPTKPIPFPRNEGRAFLYGFTLYVIQVLNCGTGQIWTVDHLIFNQTLYQTELQHQLSTCRVLVSTPLIVLTTHFLVNKSWR